MTHLAIKYLAENPRTRTKAAIKRASASARANMNRLDSGTLARLDAIYRRAADELQAAIRSYADSGGNLRLENLQQLLGQARARLGQLNQARDALLNEVQPQAAALGAAPFAESVAASTLTRMADEAVRFAQAFIDDGGLQLSDRIWRINNNAREIVERAITNAIVQGHSASQAATDLLSRGEPVPAELRAKMGIANADSVARVTGRELMAAGGPRYNAMRLFRTELNRAHGEAYMLTGAEHPDFAGWKFLLSPSHPETDICDMHARANLYGLGPGVYPSRERCPWPAHPNTLSYTEIVFKDEISEEDSAGKIGRIDWLNAQPHGIQAAVLGSQRKAAALRAGLLRQNEIATP